MPTLVNTPTYICDPTIPSSQKHRFSPSLFAFGSNKARGRLTFCPQSVLGNGWISRLVRTRQLHVAPNYDVAFGVTFKPPLAWLIQNGFTGEAKAGEARKTGFSRLLVHFNPGLQNVFTLQCLDLRKIDEAEAGISRAKEALNLTLSVFFKTNTFGRVYCPGPAKCLCRAMHGGAVEG